MKLVLKLTRSARRLGGDRYEVNLKGEAKPWKVYFPQSISRKGGVIQEEIKLEIT